MLTSKQYRYIRWAGIIVIIIMIIILIIYSSPPRTKSDNNDNDNARSSGGGGRRGGRGVRVYRSTKRSKAEQKTAETFNTQMLKQTNVFRKKIWGGGGYPLKLDDNLTKQAQAYADHIADGFSEDGMSAGSNWTHGFIEKNGDAHVGLPYPGKFNAAFIESNVGFGQNLAWNYGEDKKPAQYIGTGTTGAGTWGGECADCPAKGPCPIQGASMTGHFTQLVWKDTTHVGCAKATRGTGSGQQHAVVCNYSPRGNNEGATAMAENLPSNNNRCPFLK